MFERLLKFGGKKSALPKQPKGAAEIMDDVLRKGDSIIVNGGVKDPDTGNDISGWQGRLAEIDDDGLVTIQWDGITLKNMPDAEIEHCEKNGLDWSEMVLDKKDVNKTRPRDTAKDVNRIRNDLEKLHVWASFGAQGRRIREVIANAPSFNDGDVFQSWKLHCGKALRFPFKGTVVDWDRAGPVREGATVNVVSMSETAIDEMYGVFVTIEEDGERRDFPLCCIRVAGKKSPNRQIVEDYSFWFTNKP